MITKFFFRDEFKHRPRYINEQINTHRLFAISLLTLPFRQFALRAAINSHFRYCACSAIQEDTWSFPENFYCRILTIDRGNLDCLVVLVMDFKTCLVY